MSSLVTDIRLFYYCRFGCEMPIPAHFREVFLWVWPPKCSRILLRLPKGTSLAGNTRFGVSIMPIGQEMRHGRTLKKAKKIKKEEKKLRDVTSRIFAETTHVALPPPKLSCGWGPGRSQPCQVSFKKSVQGSKSAIFLCLALWLIQ